MDNKNTPDIEGMSIEEVITKAGLSPTMDTGEVLAMCIIIGKFLQGIPAQHRKTASSRLNKLIENGTATTEQELMIATLVSSWNTFDNGFWRDMRS